MKLRDLSLRLSYRSGRDDLVRDFFVPCLEASVLYRRAAGYFTSSGLALAARGVASLAARKGKMRLVVSPYLEPADIEALRTASENPIAALRAIAARSLRDLEDALVKDRLNALAWLAASGSLEIKLALRLDASGGYARGIFHEKAGIFTDAEESQVTFSGSSNETAGGLLENFESIKVFRSWTDAEGRVQEDLENFDRLWGNATAGLQVLDFSDAGAELLEQFKTSGHPPRAQEPTTSTYAVDAFTASLWPHQLLGLHELLTNKCGVIEMATGTGKTRLAIAACKKLVSEERIDTIIVAADGTDLLDQWFGNLLDLVTKFDRPWSVSRQYGQHRERETFAIDPTRGVLLVSRQFLGPALRGLTAPEAGRTILIHDEVHRLGSPANRETLSGLARPIAYRVGLSATPEREYDEEGNAFIEAEIGKVIFRFGLEEAISKGILAPFDYFPIPYELDDDDRARVQAVYARKAARQREGSPMSNEEVWTEIAKVYKTSRAKLPPFRDFLGDHLDLLTRCIVFVETKEYGSEVLDIIHSQHHEFHTYFADEEAETLRRFARGDLECLVTCHRLSEGIDIKSLSTVVLFSSARARLETIQRMGRCLRIDPANPKKRARVVDFVRDDYEADIARAEWLGHLSLIRTHPTEGTNGSAD